jgi:hypothetical protein
VVLNLARARGNPFFALLILNEVENALLAAGQHVSKMAENNDFGKFK